ncbi:hypothetical protein [Sphaerospermopsis torques-reginae]|uniref:Uncharacterized protein n=1 Tax=Sphaerospermopsis torques-reginae ITEP-024 TaxID=984208 RepID=A0ABX8X5A0_9CYAN|nr:hypothetical protein [Sphaerospermopsis torques-reginae]QYX33850.1 hypothetical protein K2F26_11400 [Sphaerospermopsis torques-reginae ITEP-024]
MSLMQDLCHFPVGWVERSETQRKLNVFVGFRSSTQPTNQDIFDFGEGIVMTIKNF